MSTLDKRPSVPSESGRTPLPEPVARWRWYLPLDCPACGRHRLEYRTNDGGNVVQVKCEKCGFDSAHDESAPARTQTPRSAGEPS
jgi:uncharacterized protein (DUF983 family)